MLLIVDVQVDVMSRAWQAPRVIDNISRLVARARNQGVPLIWVQHSAEDLPYGSAQWQWVPDLAPARAEPQIHKVFELSFEQTALEEELSKHGATHIVLAGTSTNLCIRATEYGVLERGYDLTLVEDAHTTTTMPLENGACVDAESVVREFNISMTWVRYPGRSNGTATADRIDFAGA